MTCVATSRMEWLFQRCHKEAVFFSGFRSVLLMSCLLLVLSVSMYPGLWSIGVQLHSAFTGSYAPGHHSLLLINSPNELAARDIGRAIMERQLAASINILARTSTMYYWKGEIQDASEVLMLVKTKTSRIQQVMDFVRSVHPYANPEVLSFLVEDGSLAYMKWMDEAIPDD
ncbi:protein CutA homolog isoform X1 [Gymnodraco acuticeps]|uniref:Protein CutA homolog isoform X1 n=2 Tax=Gymnodraco acuticeps TaxID=8218 RepID=A0A6P8W7K8_GYMAC|nr:protein CutA homolog isoform X1 [Gymnodraco acuticeps]XP_034094888.1 protein CutA homolog isoform X1 [Gymnodraco acuticeps]